MGAKTNVDLTVFTVSIPRAVKDEVRARAAELGISANQFYRLAVYDALDKFREKLQNSEVPGEPAV